MTVGVERRFEQGAAVQSMQRTCRKKRIEGVLMYGEVVYKAVSRSQGESKISCPISMKHTANQEWTVQQEVAQSLFPGSDERLSDWRRYFDMNAPRRR